MRGYLNLFEGECMFIGEKSFPVHKGMEGFLIGEPYKGKKALVDIEDGSWILRGEDFVITRVQGVEIIIKEAQPA